MPIALLALLVLRSMVRSRAELQLENLTLRHQVCVLQRSARKRSKLTPLDRLFWVFLTRFLSNWRSTLVTNRSLGGPETGFWEATRMFAYADKNQPAFAASSVYDRIAFALRQLLKPDWLLPPREKSGQ